MSMQVLNMLKRRAGHMPAGSVFYNWSLKGPAPERIVVRPVDAWPGDAGKGHDLAHADWSVGIARYNDFLYMQGFQWMRDVRAAAADRSEGRGLNAHYRRMMRGYIYNWCQHYGQWQGDVWRADITGERLAMWLSAYEFFGQDPGCDAEEEEFFGEMFFDALIRQARHLSKSLHKDWERQISPIGRLRALKGLLYAGLAFEGCESWITQALAGVSQEIDGQILGDGAHRSRSPAQLQEALQIFLDMRMNLRVGDYPCPEKLSLAIERMGPALRFFRYTDKKLALFNGGKEGDTDLLDCILGQAGLRHKTMHSLPCAGYERLSQGRTNIVLDCGPAPKIGFDKTAHAAPLAFEFSYGRERIVVNCGTHTGCPDWQEALRATAAHSTVSIDDRNACEIKASGHFARKVQHPSHIRESLNEALLVEASHDGYLPLNGITHRRRLYLGAHGEDFRGEDILSHTDLPERPIPFVVRFHLHSRVMISLIRDGQEALLRLPYGAGWRFHQSGGTVTLEDSVYLGADNVPRKTRQIAITGHIVDRKHSIKWAFQREGHDK